MKRIHRIRATWLAIGALLLGALWPLFAPAPRSDSGLLAEVCAIDGNYHVDFGAGAEGDEQPTRLIPHCAFCTIGGDRIALPPPVAHGVASLIDPDRIKPEERPVPRPEAAAEHRPRPRAPPVLS